MSPLAIIALIVAAPGAYGAAVRLLARSYAPVMASLAVLLGGAALCAALSSTKISGFLPGILSTLMALLLLCRAGGVILGAVLGLLWIRLGDPATPHRASPGRWDLIVCVTVTLIAVILSLMEN